jgi:TPR repeat protein
MCPGNENVLMKVLKTCCYIGGFISFLVALVIAYQELPKTLALAKISPLSNTFALVPQRKPEAPTEPCGYGQIEDMEAQSCTYAKAAVHTDEVSYAVPKKTSEIVDDLRAKRLKEAKEKLEPLVLQGHPLALSLLGNIYEHGQFFGKNLEKAKELFEFAIKQDSAEAKTIYAQFLLRNFRGDKTLMKKAEALLIKASDEGDPDALEHLARMFWSEDPKRALPFTIKAAEAGLSESQRVLGLSYLEGDLVPQDKHLGFKWLEKAALNEDPSAMLSLAKCYLNGIGTDKDITTGLTWAWISATLKEPNAPMLVGYSLYHGIHGIKDEINGLMWLKVANEHITDKQDPRLIQHYKELIEQAPEWLNKATARMALKCFKEGQCGEPGWNTNDLDANTSL